MGTFVEVRQGHLPRASRKDCDIDPALPSVPILCMPEAGCKSLGANAVADPRLRSLRLPAKSKLKM